METKEKGKTLFGVEEFQMIETEKILSLELSQNFSFIRW